MKRVLLSLAMLAFLGSSTGCCLVDRIFHCHHGWCGPSTYEDCCWEGHDCGGCGGCCDTGCDSCGGGCDSCGGGGCSSGGCSSCGGGSYDTGCTGCGGGDMYADSGMHGGPMMAGGPGCANGHCNLAARRLANTQGPPGPPTAAVTYPYYTNRGPRDFLARNPGNIGP
ncbi:MAG: hypothetical protein KF708_05720 [Pirellulales bacterium]|nr:hypothetical protein [Pirellulales bacterium]